MLKISPFGIDFIKKKEFFVDHAYQDSVGIWTIGYGATFYSSGQKVVRFDVITELDAVVLLNWHIDQKVHAISPYIKAVLNQNKMDAIISLVYNIGSAAFVVSTLLSRINSNPNDPAIRDAFMMWNKAKINGELKVLPGLTNRRKSEADLYFL